MKLTPLALRCLRHLERATVQGPVILREFTDSLGGNRGSWYVAIRALEDGGYVVRKKAHDKFMNIALTEKGCGELARPSIRDIILRHKKDETALAEKKYIAPQQKISDEARLALYRGSRYDNYQGREIVDNRPVSRPPTLEGYGSNEVA